MSDWTYTNPRHNCPALGDNTIVPKVCKMVNGELKPWGFKCPICSVGRKFTADEEEQYLKELMEEGEDDRT